MPVPGRQEQTLVYRVELDESSVAQIIRTARESIGVGLQQATQVGGDIVTQGQLTGATAMAQVGSHLEFLQRTRAQLSAPGSVGNAAAGMGIAQALGVKAGMVSPGFSETQRGLESRANAVLGGGASGTAGLEIAKTGASVGLAAAGLATMLMGPMGWVATAGLIGTEMALDGGITAGFDRAINRRGMAGHMRRFGRTGAMGIARQFERDAAEMEGSYSDLSAVANATMTNVHFRPGDDVNRQLVQAVGDWRIAGKALGIEKEDALSVVSELYRSGFRPGQAAGFLGRVGALADASGMNPNAINSAALQFSRTAQTQGFDAAGSGNEFLIQTGMMNQMFREGVISRSDLTAAAGFAGPVAEQQLAAVQNRVGQTMALQQTGFGRAILAGYATGSRGGVGALMAGAAGMSVQDAMEMGMHQTRAGMSGVAATGEAAVELAGQVVTGMGAELTEGALTTQLKNMGYDHGTALLMAKENLTPGARGISNLRGRRQAMSLSLEANSRSSIIGEVVATVESKLGDAVEYGYSGVRTQDALGVVLGPLVTAGMTGMAADRGREYRGVVQGPMDWASETFDASFGELGRDTSEFFGAMGRSMANAFFGVKRQSTGRGNASGTFFSKSELLGMSSSRRRGIVQRTSELRGEYASMFGDDPEGMRGTRFSQFLREREQQIYQGILDDSGTMRTRLSSDTDVLNRQFKFKGNADDVLGLLGQAERVNARIQREGSTLEEREEIESEFRGQLASMPGMAGLNLTGISDFLLRDKVFAFSGRERKALVGNMDAQAMAGLQSARFGTKAAREEFAGRFIKKGSKFADLIVSLGDGADDSSVRKLVQKAGAAGELNRRAGKDIRELTAEGSGVTAAIMNLGYSDVAGDASMERGEIKEEEAKPSEGKSSEDIATLARAMTETNSLIRQLLERVQLQPARAGVSAADPEG